MDPAYSQDFSSRASRLIFSMMVVAPETVPVEVLFVCKTLLQGVPYRRRNSITHTPKLQRLQMLL